MKRRRPGPERPIRPAGRADDAAPARSVEHPLRIIGGQFRGRKLSYSGDPRTRPMKERVREALFNLLAESVRGRHAIDLFAGTGALGFEALSRGAIGATFLERHYPTARLIDNNAAELGVAGICRTLVGDTLTRFRRPAAALAEFPAGAPWLVFCSPPYELYHAEAAAMRALLAAIAGAAPPGSVMAVEADEQFDFRSLPEPDAWFVRAYLPAVLALRWWDERPAPGVDPAVP